MLVLSLIKQTALQGNHNSQEDTQKGCVSGVVKNPGIATNFPIAFTLAEKLSVLVSAIWWRSSLQPSWSPHQNQNDIYLNTGSQIELVLQVPLTLDAESSWQLQHSRPWDFPGSRLALWIFEKVSQESRNAFAKFC